MYRVLIVDDEPEIRQGLRLKIDGEKFGLELAGEASNGVEALERLEEEAYDIVITDMNMPVMDGVSFLETCRVRYPDMRLVVITGYEDFQYARAALRHQASDYLLKPVAADELADVLAKVAGELDGERQETAREAQTRWELSQYYKEMKEHFLVRLIKGEMEREAAAYERSRRFGLDAWAEAEVRFLTVGLRERAGAVRPTARPTADERTAPHRSGAGTEGTEGAARTSDRSPDQFRLPLELICRERAQESGGACEAFRDASYPGLVHFATTEREDWLRDFAAKLAEQTERLLGFELAVGFGRPATGFKQWKEGYLSSLLAWNLSESGLAEDDRRPPAGRTALTGEELKVFERYLERGELEAFERAIRQPLEEAFAASQAGFVKVIFQLYLQLESRANESRIALDHAEQLWLRPEMALALDSADKAGLFLARIAEKVARQHRNEAEENDHALIDAVLRYIGENYMTDLNLTDLAERFNYNPSYFSEMFKSKVGKTFIQYITDARMAQAIRLLEGTQLGLWDIAELTGFSNASYFSSKFKRMYGVTPSDYRQRASATGKIDSEVPKK
ncbi:response regulator transcription factor [Cohnella sp. JJ-181]|uniref:response regulator transcription factor n=1 Tax=Cohnella rhizoplanae TaxID=2974897 RepID=UPI0022FF7B3F|nr:response regulator [Cohnella sp. JJ-181]CAI6035924.1 HTH-type transcriptional activator RhaS [Cohnella sp. JJ-181]